MSDTWGDFLFWLANLSPARQFAVSCVWQSTLVCLLGFIAARVLRRHALLRAEAAVLAVLLAVATPVATFAFRTLNTGIDVDIVAERPAARMATLVADSSVAIVEAETDLAIVPPAEAAHVATVQQRRSIDAWTAVFWAWIALAIVRAVRLAWASRRLSRIVASANDEVPAAERAAFERAQRLLERGGGVRLKNSARTQVPMLVGILRPVVLLPAQSPAGVDWFQVACHELAHVRRRDNLALLLCELARIALPWQPLLTGLRREFLVGAEEACDDAVLHLGTSPVDFADQLTLWLDRPVSPRAVSQAMSQSPTSTRSRIMRLVSMPSTLPRSTTRRRFVRGAGAGLAIVATALLAALQLRAEDPVDFPPPVPTDGSVVEAAQEEAKPAELPFQPSVISPGDILQISMSVFPREDRRIEPGDLLQIVASNTIEDEPIRGSFRVYPDNSIVLGASYGKVIVGGETIAEATASVNELLAKLLRHSTAIVQFDPATFAVGGGAEGGEASEEPRTRELRTVAPDGKISLPYVGSITAEGLTVDELQAMLANYGAARCLTIRADVSIAQLGTRTCFIVHRIGEATRVTRVELTGVATLLDVLTDRNKGVLTSETNITLLRTNRRQGNVSKVKYRWPDIVLGESDESNPRIQAGDRILVETPVKGAASAP